MWTVKEYTLALKSKLVKIKWKYEIFVIKRAIALIFEPHEGTIYIFIKLKYESFSSNIKQAFDKTFIKRDKLTKHKGQKNNANT